MCRGAADATMTRVDVAVKSRRGQSPGRAMRGSRGIARGGRSQARGASRAPARAHGDGFRRARRSYLLKAHSTWEPAVTQHLRQTTQALLPSMTNVTPVG